QMFSVEQGKIYAEGYSKVHILKYLSPSESDSSKRHNSHYHVVLQTPSAIEDSSIKIAPTVQPSFISVPARHPFSKFTCQTIIPPIFSNFQYFLLHQTAAIFESTNLLI
ncbi:MAG: hypothetical protein ACWGOD_08650, partial [Desulfobulbales bacterium]